MSAPPLVHESLAEIPEDKLVNRIVTDMCLVVCSVMVRHSFWS
jgi:hypothetical protein